VDPTIRTDAGHEGIVVNVEVNGHPSSGLNQIARHRPTRYALIMRRERANAVRRARGEQQLPGIPRGDCGVCAGLGVVGEDRGRCPHCNGSGER